MRALCAAGLLLALSLFAQGAPAAESADGWLSARVTAAEVLAQATPAPGTAKPSQRPAELDYLPRDEGDSGGLLGWALIAAAIVLAIVIVVFVIRHRRTGRPG